MIVILRFLLGFTAISCVLCAAPLPDQAATTDGTTPVIRVYNLASAPRGDVRAGLAHVTTLLEPSGIAPLWVDCGKPQPLCEVAVEAGDIVIRIVSNGPKLASQGRQPAGEAVGAYITVFWKTVVGMAIRSDTSVTGVFGLVLAHEIGHLLLGWKAHSAAGIMRPNFRFSDLQRAERQRPSFLPHEVARMRLRLSERVMIAAHR